MVPFEALYGRRCRSLIGWFAVGESSLLGLEFISKTLENVHIIRNRLKPTYNWQKSYAYHSRRDLEFEEGDKLCLKISPYESGGAIWQEREVESLLCGSLLNLAIGL